MFQLRTTLHFFSMNLEKDFAKSLRFQESTPLSFTVLHGEWTYLSNIVQVLTDDCHVVCPLKQLLSVKLPSLVPPRGLNFGSDLKVLFFPYLQHSLSLRSFDFDFFCVCNRTFPTVDKDEEIKHKKYCEPSVFSK